MDNLTCVQSYDDTESEITEEKGVDIRGVLAEFIEWCDKSDLIIGHNVEFDYNMVIIELMRITRRVLPFEG